MFLNENKNQEENIETSQLDYIELISEKIYDQLECLFLSIEDEMETFANILHEYNLITELENVSITFLQNLKDPFGHNPQWQVIYIFNNEVIEERSDAVLVQMLTKDYPRALDAINDIGNTAVIRSIAIAESSMMGVWIDFDINLDYTPFIHHNNRFPNFFRYILDSSEENSIVRQSHHIRDNWYMWISVKD